MAVLEAQQAFGRFNGSKETELLAWLRRMLLNNVVTFRRHWEQTAKRRGKPRGVDGGDSTTAGVQPAADTPTPSRQLSTNSAQVECFTRLIDHLPEAGEVDEARHRATEATALLADPLEPMPAYTRAVAALTAAVAALGDSAK